MAQAYKKDPRVDEYIRSMPLWQQPIAEKVRDIIHAADPGVEEIIKRTVQPYFALKGNVCALLSAKTHLNIFIYDPIVPDPQGLINQGHDNSTARAIQVHPGDLLDEEALLQLLKEVIENNHAGGWRKIQKEQTQ